MSKLRKFLFIALGMLIFLIAFSIKTNAASLTISTSKSQVAPGESFTVTVRLSNGAGSISSTGHGATWLDNSSYSYTMTAGNSNVSISASGVAGDYTTEQNQNVSASCIVKVAAAQPTSTTNPQPTTNPTPSTAKPTLSNLGIKPYDFSGFRAANLSYSVNVPNDCTSVTVYASSANGTVSGTGAITLNDTAYKVFLNARSISDNKVHAVQYPSEYKFMTYEIPEEIKPYVTLTPSQHVMDVSPQFFDLTFNNILTIKDALEGDYFYCLNVTDNFPDHLKGKLWEIKMTLHEEWFTALPPDINDPTGIHDYHITIPSIRFGVPDSNGKLYYNLGQAKEMVYTFRLYKEFEIKGIKLINETIADDFKQISTQNDEDKTEVLYNLYESYPSDEEIVSKIKYSKVPDADTFYNLYTFNLTEAFPLFPFEVKPSLPYQSELYLLVQSYSPHSPYGYRNLITSTKINYNDGRKVKKASASQSYINIY